VSQDWVPCSYVWRLLMVGEVDDGVADVFDDGGWDC
jgi:hypothetical protein